MLFLDDDTIRTWYQLYQEDGIEGLARLIQHIAGIQKRQLCNILISRTELVSRRTRSPDCQESVHVRTIWHCRRALA